VNATEIAIYAVETKTIIHVLWGLLLIASISLVGVSITYVLVRIELRSAEKRERQLTRHVATAGAEIRRLEERLASLLDLEAQVPALKAKLQRTQAMCSKLEAQSVTQEQERDYEAQRQAA